MGVYWNISLVLKSIGRGTLTMKKFLLGLFVVSIIISYLSCGYDAEKENVLESATVKMLSVRTFTVNEIETRMVMWEKQHYITLRVFKSMRKARLWLLYPVDKITDDLEGKTVTITYYITRLKSPPIIFVTDIRVVG